MKYKDRDELVSSLRELADFVEEKGLDLPVPLSVHVTAQLPYYERKTFEKLAPAVSKRMVKQIVRTLKPVEKKYSGGSLELRRKFGTIPFHMYVNREVVCKQVKTGNKIVHAAHYIPERVEDEVEWVCTDPLLKAS